MDHDPAPQSLGDLAAAPQAVNGSAVLRERSGPPGDKRLARGSSRGAYGPSRQVRTALDDRQTFARVPRLTRPRRSAAHWAELCPESGPDGSRFSESIGPRLSVVVRCASGPCMGRVWGRGRGRRHTWHRQRGGGCQEKRRVCVRRPYAVFTCGCSCVSSYTGRDVTRQQTRRGRERPPLICRWRGSAKGAVSATVSGTVSDTHPRLWGRSRPYVSLREDSPAAPADRATTAGAPGRSTAHHAAGGRLES